MNINENQEFEAINQKTRERSDNAAVEFQSTEDFYHAKKVKAKQKAIVCIAVTVVILLVSVFGIIGLEDIGWINTTFRTVLLCLAGCMAMFKTGYFWHEIKK